LNNLAIKALKLYPLRHHRNPFQLTTLGNDSFLYKKFYIFLNKTFFVLIPKKVTFENYLSFYIQQQRF